MSSESTVKETTVKPKKETAGRPKKDHTGLRFLALGVIFLGTVLAGLFFGSADIPFRGTIDVLTGANTDPVTYTIVHDIRFPRTVTAVLVGAALGVSGLQMQTLFRNPLADPYVLGISSGASLGVALVVLSTATSAGATQFAAGLGLGTGVIMVLAAACGSAIVLTIVMAASRFIRSSTVLLLLGVMIGYFVSAGVTVLLSHANPQMVAEYTRWQFGSYHGVTVGELRVVVPVFVLGIVATMALASPLNALLLGERYARTLGINLRLVRALIIASTSVLAGTATAYCGPIGFLGIAIPHVTRGLLGTADHRLLLPGCVLIGGSVALAADLLAQLPGNDVLPINAVNAIFGAPVVMAILIRWYRGSEAA